MTSRWVNESNALLLADLYELTMLQSYFHEGMNGTAVFDLFVRRLPEQRNYLIACGLEHVLAYLETASFSPEALAYLKSLNRFSGEFLDSLADFRFAGDIYAVPEGTVVFANEPIIEVVAPLPQAQLVETFLMELNPNHEIIGKMRDRAEDAMFDDFAEVLYGYAVLAEGSELTEPLKFNQALVRVLGKV